MTGKWRPDITDPALITPEKAAFIFDSAEQFLGETIDLADYLNANARKTLAFATSILSAVTAYILLQCDIAHGICGEKPQLFLPGVILLIGYAIGAAILIIGCLVPQPFRFRGNQPENLLKTDVCKFDLDRIKLGEVVNMAERINLNVQANKLTAWCLIAAYAVTVCVPIISFIAAIF